MNYNTNISGWVKVTKTYLEVAYIDREKFEPSKEIIFLTIEEIIEVDREFNKKVLEWIKINKQHGN